MKETSRIGKPGICSNCGGTLMVRSSCHRYCSPANQACHRSRMDAYYKREREKRALARKSASNSYPAEVYGTFIDPLTVDGDI